MDAITFAIAVLCLAAGAAAGAFLYPRYLAGRIAATIRLPRHWPLVPRAVLTEEEQKVFAWLQSTFEGYLVMAKLPVVRYTKPIDKTKNGGGDDWQALLNNVYCTFAICNANGNVVGCVDVPGKNGLAKANRQLKEGLLGDCHIPYTVVRSTAMPQAGMLRAAFLGETAMAEQPEYEATVLAPNSFHADIDNFSKNRRNAVDQRAALKELNDTYAATTKTARRPAGFNPDGTGAFDPEQLRSSSKQFQDSFLRHDDSQPAKLG
jgi:Protein of unknown function (DUF2726)